MEIQRGDAIDLIEKWDKPIDLIVTDPPYSFGGHGQEHALTAKVAVVLREAAKKLVNGSWMLVYSASSWRSIIYMVEAVRSILSPVRVAVWNKPVEHTKVKTIGWAWSTVCIIAMRKGPKNRAELELEPNAQMDYMVCEPVKGKRRAKLPERIAYWSIKPFVVPGGVFLDPFAGSESLVVASEFLGMKGYGFEIKNDNPPLGAKKEE